MKYHIHIVDNLKKKHQLVNHDSSIAYRTVSDIQCGDIKLMLDRIYIYVYIY